MGRTKKFPPLKDDTLALTVLPNALKPESLEARKREVSLLARVKLDENFDQTVDRIMQLEDTLTNDAGHIAVSLEVLRLKLDTLKWLTDRGYGKAPQIVKLGTDEGTPEGILAKIARQRTEALQQKLEADRIRATAIDTVVVTE